MRMLGLLLTGAGLMLAGLGGLEKVIIYLVQARSGSDMYHVIQLTPKYIWNITNFTLYGGIIISLVGLILYFYKRIAAEMRDQNLEMELDDEQQ